MIPNPLDRISGNTLAIPVTSEGPFLDTFYLPGLPNHCFHLILLRSLFSASGDLLLHSCFNVKFYFLPTEMTPKSPHAYLQPLSFRLNTTAFGSIHRLHSDTQHSTSC